MSEWIKVNSKKRRGYFKRLADHPGNVYGVIYPIIGAAAAANNPNVETAADALAYASIGFVFLGVFIWSIILFSNLSRD